MAIGSLIMGILGLVLFCWLGPVLGGSWAAVSSLAAGQAVVWPVWLLGIVIGVGFPMLAVFLSIGGFKQNKGVALAGLIVGIVSAVIGLIITLATVFTFSVAEEAKELLDPMTQQGMQQGLKQMIDDAANQQGGQ